MHRVASLYVRKVRAIGPLEPKNRLKRPITRCLNTHPKAFIDNILRNTTGGVCPGLDDRGVLSVDRALKDTNRQILPRARTTALLGRMLIFPPVSSSSSASGYPSSPRSDSARSR